MSPTAMLPLLAAAALLIDTPSVRAEAARGLLPNPGFDDALDGWVFRPGDDSQATVTDAGDERGNVLELEPGGKLLGVETERLPLDGALKADQAYQVTAQLKSEGLRSGIFAFSMYCWDAAGKSLKQIAFYPLSTRSKPHDWREIRGEFGPGTHNPLPEGTKSICIRFSFHEKTGNCQGKVVIDDVTLQPYDPPAHEGWPKEIVADVGDLQVRFESRSFWTLYRLDYKGTRLGLDRWGSHWGSVLSFPGTGFIGTGHTENEDEQVLDLKLFVDGKPVEQPDPAVRCDEVRLQKQSRIRDFVLDTDITVRDGRVFEDVRLRANKATKMTLIYHFMHPWTFTATEYLAELPDGTKVDGKFVGDKGMRIDKPTRWSAIYDGPSGKGALTYVLAVPKDDDWRTRYWDIDDRYRKHYFVTFIGKTVPAAKEYRYRIVTVPFQAAQTTWKDEAARVAAKCGKQE